MGQQHRQEEQDILGPLRDSHCFCDGGNGWPWRRKDLFYLNPGAQDCPSQRGAGTYDYGAFGPFPYREIRAGISGVTEFFVAKSKPDGRELCFAGYVLTTVAADHLGEYSEMLRDRVRDRRVGARHQQHSAPSAGFRSDIIENWERVGQRISLEYGLPGQFLFETGLPQEDKKQEPKDTLW